jgi:hypothetical protein
MTRLSANLMIFVSALASLVARRVVQGVETHRFKTSAIKKTLQTFLGHRPRKLHS